MKCVANDCPVPTAEPSPFCAAHMARLPKSSQDDVFLAMRDFRLANREGSLRERTVARRAWEKARHAAQRILGEDAA